MRFLRIYGRVLLLLWPERWLSIALIIGNLGIAGIGFLEPILFGRVIDVLATSALASLATGCIGALAAFVLGRAVGHFILGV